MPASNPSREFSAVLSKHGYTAVKKIGEGSFGVAVLAEDSDKAKLVCKMVNVSGAKPAEVQEARKEARLLAQLKHPYIVRYRENFAEKGWLCIVMDFCEGGDLTQQIDAMRAKKAHFPQSQVVRWFAQAVMGLKYLHDKHVLHRDLKPSNFFLTKAGDLRMGDFGMAKALSSTVDLAQTFAGTPYYLSPELIKEKPYAWPSDIWAMGCILYQLCALQLYDGMMKRRPENRISAAEILSSALIQQAVKDLLSEKKGAAPSADPNVTVRQEIQDQFNRFDVNGDGVIDKAELGQVLSSLDAAVWTAEKVDQVLKTVDTNGDGKIQLDEFVLWIFGGGSEVGLIERTKGITKAALKAASEEDFDALCTSVRQWREAADIGCLRVSNPGSCIETCETLSWMGLQLGSFLREVPRSRAQETFGVVRDLASLLDSVARLLDECRRRHVVRVAGVQSRAYLRGLCLELADGTRLGQCPAGLSDASLEASPATWQDLLEGEHIVEAKGFGMEASAGQKPAARQAKGRRSPSPPPAAANPPAEDSLAACVTLVTNRGRQLHFGGSHGGAAFSFKASEGLEIEDIKFENHTCTGVTTAPFSLSWPQESLDRAREAFKSAVESLSPVLLEMSWQRSQQHGKHALLQAMQLGLEKPAVPEAVRQEFLKVAASLAPPLHWDRLSMPTADVQKWIEDGNGVCQLSLKPSELEGLQAMVSACYCPKPDKRREPSRLKAPAGLELTAGVRLQNWPAWASFAAREDTIRQQLKLEGAQVDLGDSVASDDLGAELGAELAALLAGLPPTSAQLRTAGDRPAGLTLDDSTGGAWLFHNLNVMLAEAFTGGDLGVVQAEDCDNRLYGRGVYLSEFSDAVDELNAESVDGLRCMLLCRVALGRVLTDEALLPDVSNLTSQCVGGPFHSVVGDRAKRRPDALHREFIVYDADQVYPEFLLWYRRVYSK
eukprot:TRINITY_DN3308_c0_g1_i2.p1 TRINITY_DN3308_c0_g1~~TRINITY_DN3308_c0_g1_i2.p1  ORF type:complete len:946 (+),score=280.96 TRINITY_DN3308_c0_g1_i2:123-2960(+)